MGFLSGVLSNIKEHLGQHKTEISEAITLLEQNKHAGKKGFNEAIERVVAGVRGYSGNVKSSNEAVIEPLKKLLNYTKKNEGELITSINKIQVNDPTDPLLADAARSFGDRLKEATDRSKRCAEFLDPKADKNTKMKQNINDLNDKLRDKVLHVRKLVEYENQRLASVHKRKDAELKETTEKIKDVFAKLKSCINNKVAEDVKKLVENLSERVRKILKKLNEINSNLQKYINELSQWIEEAHEFATAALERINTILKHMDGTASTYTMNIKTAAESLGRDVEDLHRAGKNVKDNIADWVKNGTEKAKQLDTWKAAGDAAVGKAKGKCDEIVAKLKGSGGNGEREAVIQAAQSLQKKADELRKNAYDAKQKVTELVGKALQEVKTMDDALKQDLFAVKSRIKTEIWKHVSKEIKTPYDKLEGNVKEGLWNIERKISEDVKRIARSASSFKDKFEATKGEIHKVVSKVATDLDNLKELQKIGSIDVKLEGTVSLLKAAGGNEHDFLKPLTEYFTNLDTSLIKPLQKVMQKLGEEIGNSFGEKNLDDTFTTVDKQIQVLRLISDSSVPSTNLNALQGVLGNKFIAPKLDLETHVKPLKSLIEKIGLQQPQSTKLTKGDARNLVIAMGNIAHAVSQHFQQVVEIVIKAIKDKVIEEVKAVGTAIHGKVGNITQGIQNSDKGDMNVDYGLGKQDNVRGLQALVDDFDQKIKSEFDKLQSTLLPSAFKKNASGGSEPRNYDFGNGVMNVFKSTYDEISGKLRDTTFQAAVDNSLIAEIGPNNLAGVGDAAEKISALAGGKFLNYTNQVKQDSIALSQSDPNNLEGSLPQAIKTIETKVKEDGLLLNVENGDEENADKFNQKTFETLNGRITSNLDKFTNNVKDLVKKDGADTESVHAYVQDVETMLGQGSTVTLKSDISTSHPSVKGLETIKGEITTALENIKNQVTDNLGILATFDETALKQFEAVKENLTQLCEAIETEGEYGINNLKALLNTTIKEKLARIKTKLDEIRTFDLRAAIRDAENFLTSADPTAQATITSIRGVVSSNVEEAQNDLITQVNKNYVTSVKAILLEFAEKAEKELEPLPKEITDDLDIGYKGFMKTFEDRFVITINTMKQVNSDISANVFQEEVPPKYPLGKATEILRNAFTLLFNNLKSQPDFTSDYTKMKRTNEALAKMLDGLIKLQHFNYEFCENVDSFGNQVVRLNPSKFGDAMNPAILEAFKKGFSDLAGELSRAYISRYSEKRIKWQTIEDEEQERYAKITLTVIPILYAFLSELKYGLEYEKWNDKKIYNGSNPTSSLHALFFRDNGYDVRRPENAEHGELNHKRDFNGSSILKHLTNETHNLFSQLSSPITGIPRSTSRSDEPGVTVAEERGLIRKLYDFLQTYFSVCHLTLVDKPRAPCSVYEILVWCCGLQFNPVYEKLKAQVKSEFMKEDKLNPGTKKLQPFDAHPSDFEHTHIDEALYKVSANSHAVLTAILGHGHKDGIYACEFSNNSLKLDYPTSMIQLLCTLFDLLKRLYHQLYFLLQQCQLTTQLSGWRDCHYGRYIGGSGWQCNTKQCPKQDCDQRHDQSGNQTGDQYPNCGVKSPLQSFLEDGLKGHLPHSVAARGSSLSCSTCGSTPGMSCRTPMGFADIGAIASHTMIGRDICEVLYDFCGRPTSPLTRLCSYLNCLLPSAPKTLADMFSFYYHLTDRWGMHGNDHKSNAFNATVRAANFGRDYGKLNVYHLFSASHSALKKGHSDGSLGSLVCLSRDAVVCGPYLRPISQAIYEAFSSQHADKYLSWVVYLTASFYDLLKKLYDECNSKCGSKGSNCHVKACIKGCPTTTIEQDPPRYHDRNCKSIVSCNSTMPTLAKYGFVLGNAERLNGSAGIEKKRTCRDFCDVFAEAFDKDSHLVQLFKAIDKFMFAIRKPFIWLNVALWSLSLFYLICVMVGRLDVLHIRSHLRIPSSHKITAQSLLAAAQVGRLAKISYLQP